jgi:hypothetical protein
MNRSSDQRGSCRVAATLLAAALGLGCTVGPRPTLAAPATPPAPEIATRQILVTFVPQPALALPRAGSSAHGYEGAGGYETTARTLQLARQLGRDYGLTVVTQWPIETLGVHCVVFEVPAGKPRDEFIDRLAHDRRVESVEPMQLFTVEGRNAGDPYRDLQHGFADLGLEEAHRWASGAGVRVAIIDTGVDLSHPDLAGRIGEARDFVDDRAGRPPAERHGTAVAGVIASDRDNGIGIVGVAPRVEILALRGCWALAAGGGDAVCSSFTLAKALAFAVAAHPGVINLSVGGRWDALLERLLRAALARGIVVVAAQGESPDTRFPSGVAGVVAVRASPPQTCSAELSGELCAPGQEILTTVPGGRYDFLSGSSLAAAQVSGVAALLLEGRRVKPESLPALLRETARAATGKGGDDPPLVNACAALARTNRDIRCSLVPGGRAAPSARTLPSAPLVGRQLIAELKARAKA